MRRGAGRPAATLARATLAAAALLSVAGCSLAFRAPTLTVAEVRLVSLGVTSGSLAVSLEVENPNRYGLESRDFRYALAFAEGSSEATAWRTFVEGRFEQVVRVPARGTAPLQVMVPFETLGVGAALVRLLRQGALEYRFSGELVAGTPLGTRRIPFDQRGLFRP